MRVMRGWPWSCLPRADRGLLRDTRSRLARRGGLPRLWTSCSLFTSCVGRTRNERTDRAALGDYVSKADGLVHLVAFQAVFLVSGPCLAVLGFDTLSVRARVLVVIHLAVLRRGLGRVCVIRQ